MGERMDPKNPFFCFLSEIPMEGYTICSADRAYFLRISDRLPALFARRGFCRYPYGAEVYGR